MTIKARDIGPHDRLAIYSARRRGYRYERVRRVIRSEGVVSVFTSHGPALLLPEDQTIKVAPPANAR